MNAIIIQEKVKSNSPEQMPSFVTKPLVMVQ